MNIVIHSTEPLVFRDGRPFGDSGHVNGGMLRWPWPSTVVGMLRTRIGLSRDPDYFQTGGKGMLDPAKKKALERISAERVVPLWKKENTKDWEYLFPAPADALVVRASQQDTYAVHSFDFLDPFHDGGVDLPWKNWRIPVASTREKPARDSPELWNLATYFDWLKNNQLNGEIHGTDLGRPLPQPEVRMHTAIDPATGTVKTGQLFASQGISLSSVGRGGRYGGQLGIGVELAGAEDTDDPFGPCHFGGERRVAFVEPLQSAFPVCPGWFENKRYLRFVLITPGVFGSWAPSWLLPDPDCHETDWRKVPGTDIDVRLCSSFIPRWQPVSGWDYALRAPKATRKMVPAGAVYVVEVKDPASSQTLAQKIWGRSIDSDLRHLNGCGAVCVGNVMIA